MSQVPAEVCNPLSRSAHHLRASGDASDGYATSISNSSQLLRQSHEVSSPTIPATATGVNRALWCKPRSTRHFRPSVKRPT